MLSTLFVLGSQVPRRALSMVCASRNLISQTIQDASSTAEQLLALGTLYYRFCFFVASSLQKAELVSPTFAPWFTTHAARAFSDPSALADKVLNLGSSSGAEVQMASAALVPVCTQASSLLYSYFDAMAIDAGLRGDAKRVDAMRKKLDEVEGGFLANQVPAAFARIRGTC